MLATVYADCEFLALFDVALRGRVENRPVEFAVLWLYERPRNAHILNIRPRKPVERVGRLQIVAIVARTPRIVVVNPPHPRIYKRLFVVGKFIRNPVAVGLFDDSVFPRNARGSQNGKRRACDCVYQFVHSVVCSCLWNARR